MRRILYLCAAVVASTMASASAVALSAGDSTVARAAVVASADVRSRTAVVASTELLRFQVIERNRTAEAALTFSAGARVAAADYVLLAVSAERPLEFAFDSSDVVELAVSSDAGSVPVSAGERIVAARWLGGGVRSGQLHFQLRAAPGTYSVPVKLHVIVP
jgi:hypothetical protein